MEYPLEDQFDEAAFVPDPVGPSSRACCKVINQNSCGSGSIVGFRDNKTLVLTNAHVAGSRIGRVVKCTFPFLNNRTVDARVIMAAYSDTVMMDFAVLEIDEKLNLPAVKLSIATPGSQLYTAGYPKCQGPRFQNLTTKEITHNGTVWKGMPNSIGGQSGSGIHSLADNLQRVLLTWSWAQMCAGQTTRSIWFQYQNRAVVGFPRPEGLIELGNIAEGLEEGFFAEANITTLPIWAHLDDVTPPPPPPQNDLAKAVVDFADSLSKSLDELRKKAQAQSTGGGDATNGDDSDGPTFGL